MISLDASRLVHLLGLIDLTIIAEIIIRVLSECYLPLVGLCATVYRVGKLNEITEIPFEKFFYYLGVHFVPIAVHSNGVIIVKVKTVAEDSQLMIR